MAYIELFKNKFQQTVINNEKRFNANKIKADFLYEKHSGIFTDLRVNPIFKKISGCKTSRGYWKIGIDGKYYLAHRLAWFYVTGSWPIGDIDHINGNRIDNSFSNLRVVTRSENLQNQRRARSNNKTGLLGASLDKRSGKYVSQINIKGEVVYLGRFDTPELAHKRYVEEKRKVHMFCTI